MGDSQKGAVASLCSFDRCWEPRVPVFYFTAGRWYKRASNLSQAGITISKPRKARHCCRQISGWHRFSPLGGRAHSSDHMPPSSLFCPFSPWKEECSVHTCLLALVFWSLLLKTPSFPPSIPSSVFLVKKNKMMITPFLLSPLSLFPSLISPLFSPPFLRLRFLPGWNAAVCSSVNCGLSAAAASTPKAQSQHGWSSGWSRLPLR